MMVKSDVNLACIRDDEIINRLKGALGREREALVEFLRVLAEVEERRLHLEHAFPSLFALCVAGLGLSEDAAYRRVAACRVGRRFPRVLEMIADGSLHMTGVAKLAPHLTAANHVELLEEARGKTKTEIELLIAARFPKADVKTSVRKVAPRGGRKAKEPAEALRLLHGTRTPAKVEPTSRETYSIRFATSAETKKLLDRAKDLLGHGKQADVGQILEMGLMALVENLEKKKFAKTDRPRKSKTKKEPAPGDRYIEAWVRRAVAQKDGHRCTYVSKNGRRCPCTFGLEYDHIIPVALGGKSTVDNLRLRCRAHNVYAAEQVFGRDEMDRHRKAPFPGKAIRQPTLFDTRLRSASAFDGEADAVRSVSPTYREPPRFDAP